MDANQMDAWQFEDCPGGEGHETHTSRLGSSVVAFRSDCTACLLAMVRAAENDARSPLMEVLKECLDVLNSLPLDSRPWVAVEVRNRIGELLRSLKEPTPGI